MKRVINNIILFLIQIIEWFEYRNLELDEDNNEKKIINSIDISNNNIDVTTDNGYKRITHIHKTQPYRIYKIRTENYFLECADNHIVFDKDMNQIFIKDLKHNDKIQTETGVESIITISRSIFKVSMFDTTIDDTNHRYYTNGILSHNTTTAAFFIMWFMVFNFEKNIFIAANKLDTTVEVIDKVKVVYEYLPFFMKPGMVINNVKKIEFDNKCRIIGQATTPKPGLGFSIHLLYCDEFAHIPAHILNPFWENLFPVVSADNNAKIIITSTANGLNKFSQIYTDAIKNENDFYPLRVDWWEVPGRDEEWKKKEISNFGSEAAFNQQYGNQFLSFESILFDSYTIKLWDRIKTIFEWRYIDIFEDLEYKYKGLKWNPLFDFDEITEYDQFILSIDPADGVGRDFTVCNIFKIVPLSISNISKVKVYKSETTFFSLKQVGIFRANDVSLELFTNIINTLCFKFFNPENICVIIEINDNRGNSIVKSFENTRNYEERMIFHTHHSKNSKHKSPGVKINTQLKLEYTNKLRSLIRNRKLILYEENTLMECSAFGLNEKGVYTSQIGLDDIVMSLVNLVSFFDSYEYPDRVEEIYDYLDVSVKNEINKVMNRVEIDEIQEIDYTLLDDLM